MILTIAAAALAIQLNSIPERVAQPSVQPVQYGVPVRRPPCGHGWDVSALIALLAVIVLGSMFGSF